MHAKICMKLNITNFNTLLYDNSFDRLKKVYLKKLTQIFNDQSLIISSKENFSNKFKSSCWVDNYTGKERIFFKTKTNKILGSFVKSKKIIFSNTYLDDFRFFEQSSEFDLKRISLKRFSTNVLKITPFYKKVILSKPKRGGFIVCWQGLFGLFPKTQISIFENIYGFKLNKNSSALLFTNFKNYLKIKNAKRTHLKNKIKLNHIFIFSSKLFLMNFLLTNKKLEVFQLNYKYVS